MKKYYLLATALAAMVSCTSDDYVGDNNLQEANGQAAISFGFDVPNVTRAGGATAASALGNRFIVYGEKGDETAVAPTAGNLVFPNYQVNYAANTENTTTSNSKNWEYVGYTHTANYVSNITRKASSSATAETASDAEQTIKYWDYGAANYIFTAVSALDDDIEDGRVKIQKNEYGDDKYKKGYTIKLEKSGTGPQYTYPTLNKLFFSDRLVIPKGDNPGHDRTAQNAYGGNVTLTFRNLVSQIRAGVYETIPGYDVYSIKFYVNNAEETPSQSLEAKVDETSAFGAVCPNVKVSEYEGELTVTYYTNTDGSSIENQPKVTESSTGKQSNNLILGTNFSTLNNTTPTILGQFASSPTWDKSGGSYTEVLPQINNSSTLKLKVDYKLWNSVSGETIEVNGTTAEVPAEYLKWKPNYKYTYLFKITDDKLYPITFDAVQITAEDGNVEYITTVTEPSITTYAKSSNVTADNEYKPGSNIYIVVNKGGSNELLSASNAKLYTVTLVDTDTSDGLTTPNQTITEASVANALKTTENAGVWEVTDANKWKMTVTDVTTGTLSYPGSIAAADAPDGNAITIDCAKFSATTTYTAAGGSTLTANKRYYTKEGEENYVEYIATGSEEVAQNTYYTADLKYYVFEFTDTADDNKKYYKVIKVQ